MSTAPSFHGDGLYSHDGSWRNRGAALRDRRAESRGTEAYLRNYVEGLNDEPVGLAAFGNGQACRSSGSAIAAEVLMNNAG